MLIGRKEVSAVRRSVPSASSYFEYYLIRMKKDRILKIPVLFGIESVAVRDKFMQPLVYIIGCQTKTERINYCSIR